MPWMNGGGETIEIAVWPQGAGLASFDWRVSMARVTQPGPFSSFTGVDRTLAILDGAGLTLAVAGRHPVELTAASPGYTFPADLPVTATLADGPVLALNAMTRRDKVRHALDRLSVTAPRALRIDADWAPPVQDWRDRGRCRGAHDVGRRRGRPVARALPARALDTAPGARRDPLRDPPALGRPHRP